jgi:phosphoglycolate phosphatase
MKFTHIIWDWNGTLLDDTELCVLIINGMLEQQNLPPVSRSVYQNVFGFPVKDYYSKIGFDFNEQSFEELSDIFISSYEIGREHCSLMDGARKTLDDIADLGCTQSVLSASKQDYLEQAVLDHELCDIFQSLHGLDNHHAAGKLETGRAHLESSNLDPSSTLLVGDTLHDAQVASDLGISCCLIPNGHQSISRLQAAQVPVSRNLIYLPNFLLNLNQN